VRSGKVGATVSYILSLLSLYGARHLDGAFLGKRFKNSSNY